jgi:hypothetical protein
VAAGREGFLESTSGRPAVPHGLRSTFRDWAGELTEYPKEMAELALSHLEKRRRMMADWARFVHAREVPKVVHLDTSG